MAARVGRDMTVEEFDAWCATRRGVEDVLEASAATASISCQAGFFDQRAAGIVERHADR